MNPLSNPVQQGMPDNIVFAEVGDCKAVLATHDHAEEMAPFIRQLDKIETAAYGFTTCEAALKAGVDNDDVTFTALDGDGVPFAMMGVGSFGDANYIWLLGTDGVKDNWYNFGKASRLLLPVLLSKYDVVSNLVLKDYTDSVRWLKWLGAKFIREVNIAGYDFYEFILTKESLTKGK